MRSFIPVKLVVAALMVPSLLLSCKKNHDATPEKSQKYEQVSGTWKQQDIVLAVSAKLGGRNLPAGTSILALAPALGAAGALITCTKDNSYQFNTDGTFTINGCTDLILPAAGNNGTWKLDVHDAVFLLTSQKGVNDPHWIQNVSSNALELSITVTIPGVATAPLILKLQKQ
ncbi:DUF5004 domain-containing protein [Chitinophaga eiseniae]|uniref:DUF5004 domain-containing protein n=1 Tax=Chitinophaga eiseniae TaxID=634771 RepID=A0A847SGN7_9BACT|nr:DUF5004 domain-containing protein [Chitinophaga eiseniae]NLR80981.1 DUF5004 domain-containing protein [Chitinophaga eiseniae]